MKKIIIGVVVLVILAGGYFLLAGKKTANAPEGASVSQEQTSPPTPSPKPATSVSHDINIQDFSFDQPSLTIKKGDTIVWTNKDSAPHTVTWDVGGQQSSGTLKSGETFSLTMNTAGTFNYHCAFHPSMKGRVVVE